MPITYKDLPKLFYSEMHQSDFHNAELLIINHKLLKELNLDDIEESEWIKIIAGTIPFRNEVPVAQSYGGHQFGHFSMLGDGRAMLIAEIETNNLRCDIALKGSGPTPYARRGDGYAHVSAMLREHLISEYMAAVGIPTTRSLGVVKTNQQIIRETPKPGAVLARVAQSHIRVGTFQLAYAHKDVDAAKALFNYTIDRHYPELKDSDNIHLRFLKRVLQKQARLLAKWMSIGFVHGVMNTDNTAISGETIDYGPCAFLDTFNPKQVYSSIDREGRYAYENQPRILRWNATRLAETLIPLMDESVDKSIELLNAELEEWGNYFEDAYYNEMKFKLGFDSLNESDHTLIDRLLHLMEQESLDYTNTFRTLKDLTTHALNNSPKGKKWLADYQSRMLKEQIDDKTFIERIINRNPNIIPRNHIVDEVLIAAERGNMIPFLTFLEQLQSPYNEVDPYYTESRKTPFTTYCGT